MRPHFASKIHVKLAHMCFGFQRSCPHPYFILFWFGSSSFFTSLIPYVFHHSIGWGCQHVAALVVLCCNYLCLGSRLELSRDTAWHGNLLTICRARFACLPFNFITFFHYLIIHSSCLRPRRAGTYPCVNTSRRAMIFYLFHHALILEYVGHVFFFKVTRNLNKFDDPNFAQRCIHRNLLRLPLP